MIISKNIEIDIDEVKVTIQELRKLRSMCYDEEDYDTVEKINEIIELYEDFKNR